MRTINRLRHCALATLLRRIARHRAARVHMRLAAALLAVAAFAAVPAHAQENVSTLRGTITLPGDAAATQVIAIDVASGYRRTSGVDPSGKYNFTSLRPGRYRLEIATPAGPRAGNR